VTADQTYAGDEIPPGTEVIDVHVAELTQIFNSFDPSPFHEKDLDDDADEFIVGWAKELPRQKPLALRVQLDKPAVTPEMANALREAVHSYYAAAPRSRPSARGALPGRVGRPSSSAWRSCSPPLRRRPDCEGLAAARPNRSRKPRHRRLGRDVAPSRDLPLYDWVPIRRDRRLF
jgi:hypothetical protein